MPHVDSNIRSNIYYVSIDPEIFRFARNTSDINAFVALFNRLFERMQKQGSKHRSIISKLNKIFSKGLTIFDVSVEKGKNFIKLFSLT